MNLEVIGAGRWRWSERCCGSGATCGHDIAELRRDLTAQIAAVNTRIDNILLADRKTP